MIYVNIIICIHHSQDILKMSLAEIPYDIFELIIEKLEDDIFVTDEDIINFVMCSRNFLGFVEKYNMTFYKHTKKDRKYFGCIGISDPIERHYTNQYISFSESDDDEYDVIEAQVPHGFLEMLPKLKQIVYNTRHNRRFLNKMTGVKKIYFEGCDFRNMVYPPNIKYVDLGQFLNYEIIDGIKTHYKMYIQNGIALPDSVVQITSKTSEFIIFPKYLRSICLVHYNYNNRLPDSIEQLMFNTCNSENIYLPKNLKYLKIGHINSEYYIYDSEDNDSWDLPRIYPTINLPNKLTYFELLCRGYDGIIKWGDSLEYVKIMSCYNQDISALPNSVETLILADCFDTHVTRWPENLQILQIGNKFDKNISNLHDKVTQVIIGNSFNTFVSVWPLNLQYLDLGNSFNQDISILPDSIQTIKLGNNFNTFVSKWPKSLKYLWLGDAFDQYIIDLPDDVVQIILGKSFDKHFQKWPRNLESLEIGNSFNQDISNLCDNVKYIKIGNNFNVQITQLPEKLEYLIIGNRFNKPIIYFPPKLKHLEIGNNFNRDILDMPDTIVYIKLGSAFNGTINKLSNNLQYLILGNFFNKSIELPNSLLSFSVGDNFNKKIRYPSDLNYLKIGKKFQQDISDLPNTLRTLILGYKYKGNFNMPNLECYLEMNSKNRCFVQFYELKKQKINEELLYITAKIKETNCENKDLLTKAEELEDAIKGINKLFL